MGRALARHLRACGFDVSAPPRADVQLSSVEALAALVAEAAPAQIVNLAGISSVTHGDDRALYEVNAFGHLNVLEAVARIAPRARVFLASSANVYGQSKAEAFAETDPPAPINHYAISKLTAEQFNRLLGDRLSVAAVRPFNCTGRGQKPTLVISKLVDAFRKRAPRLELGALDVRRDYVDIRDVCAMWEAVLAAPSPPPIVNFGTGVATPLRDVIALLEKFSGHSMEIVSAAQFMRARDIAYQRADTRVLDGLGFRRKHDLADTLAWMLSDDGEDA